MSVSLPALSNRQNSAAGTDQFESQGFTLVENLLNSSQLEAAVMQVQELTHSGAGTRNLLAYRWCAELADTLRKHPAIASLFASIDYRAVQCTLFEKSEDRNWLVGLHQDLSIPVAAPVEHPELSGWSHKEGVHYVQPPIAVLNRMIALRLHLDDCGPDDGPLKIVPTSHFLGRLSGDVAAQWRQENGEHICCASRGSVLAMRPLCLHASSKSNGISRRRVLHFLFGPAELPYGLRWHEA